MKNPTDQKSRTFLEFYRFLRHTAYVIGGVFAVYFIADRCLAYSVEAAKQQAAMMRACVEAGGQWKKNMGPTWNCVHPEKPEKAE